MVLPECMFSTILLCQRWALHNPHSVLCGSETQRQRCALGKERCISAKICLNSDQVQQNALQKAVRSRHNNKDVEEEDIEDLEEEDEEEEEEEEEDGEEEGEEEEGEEEEEEEEEEESTN